MRNEKSIIEQHIFKDTSQYQDIMNLPHHKSKAHLPMSKHDRAGQFAPFSALTGYHSLIDKTAERYERKQYPSYQQQQRINKHITNLSRLQPVEINYFNAESGYYETIKANYMQVSREKACAVFINTDHSTNQKYEIPLANIKTIRNLTTKKPGQ